MNRSWSTSSGPAGFSPFPVVSVALISRSLAEAHRWHLAAPAGEQLVLAGRELFGGPATFAAVERVREREALHKVHTRPEHDEHLARHVGRGVAREEHDEWGDVLRLPLGSG